MFVRILENAMGIIFDIILLQGSEFDAPCNFSRTQKIQNFFWESPKKLDFYLRFQSFVCQSLSFSATMESEGRQVKQYWIKYLRIRDLAPSWPLDPGYGMGKKTGSGPGIRIQDIHISESLENNFLG